MGWLEFLRVVSEKQNQLTAEANREAIKTLASGLIIITIVLFSLLVGFIIADQIGVRKINKRLKALEDRAKLEDKAAVDTAQEEFLQFSEQIRTVKEAL